MITGLQFPTELETNKDLYVYRKYLHEKMQEPKTSYLSFLPATILGAGLGSFVAKKGVNKPIQGLIAGATIPALIGYGLVRYDNKQIERAKELANMNDDELGIYLEGKQQRIRERPPELQKVMKIQSLFAKTAGMSILKPMKTIGKVVGGTVAGAGLLTGGAVLMSKAHNPEKWIQKDPVTAWAAKPKIQIR